MYVLNFDIETVSSYATYEEFKLNDSVGAELFHKKAQRFKWLDANTIDEVYELKAGVISTYGKIVCISYSVIKDGKIHVFNINGDEQSIVERFKHELDKISIPNWYLGGFNINMFDIPWLQHKMILYNIEIPEILEFGKKPWDMRVFDYYEIYKQKNIWSSSFEEVLYEFGIDSPKDKMDGSEVSSFFYKKKDIDSIIEYCNKDAYACCMLQSKLKIGNSLIY